MAAAAPALTKLKVEPQSANEASSIAAVDEWREQRVSPQEWTAVLQPQTVRVRRQTGLLEPFEAIRLEYGVTAPSLRLADEDERSVPLRIADSVKERYHGLHGRLVVISRK